jgi:hypothetical protein
MQFQQKTILSFQIAIAMQTPLIKNSNHKEYDRPQFYLAVINKVTQPNDFIMIRLGLNSPIVLV